MVPSNSLAGDKDELPLCCLLDRRDLRKLSTIRQGIPTIPASPNDPEQLGPFDPTERRYSRVSSNLGRYNVQSSAISAPHLGIVPVRPMT